MTDTHDDRTLPPAEGGLEHRMSTLEAAFESVAQRMGDLADSIGNLVDTVRKDRRMMRLLAVSVALDLLLSVGFFYNLHRTNNATREAQVAATAAGNQSEVNQATIRATCEAANETRSEAVTLWTRLLMLPAGAQAPTPAQQAQLDGVLALVNQVYAQRSCAP